MGQAKARGTRDERVQHALANPPKVKRLSKRETKELIAQTTMEYVGKIFCELGVDRMRQ